MSIDSLQALRSDPTQVRKATKSSTSLGDFLAAAMQTRTSETIKSASPDQSVQSPWRTAVAMRTTADSFKPRSVDDLSPRPEPALSRVSAPLSAPGDRTFDLAALPLGTTQSIVGADPTRSPTLSPDRGRLIEAQHLYGRSTATSHRPKVQQAVQ